MVKKSQKLCFYFAFIISLVSTLGSLFFSEVMSFPPCVLCWYQRIAMYPLVVIIAFAIILNDYKCIFSAFFLNIVGLGVSIYHNLLYYKIIPESLSPCVQGVSCTSIHIQWFGFITIPLLALSAFILIFLLLVFSFKKI